MSLKINQTSTKFKQKSRGLKFTNISSNDFKNSARNLSKLLKDRFINPWSVLDKQNVFQVIEESGSYYEYDGLKKNSRLNLIGILAFSVAFGVVLSKMGEQGRLMTQWFTILLEVTMKMVNIVIW